MIIKFISTHTEHGTPGDMIRLISARHNSKVLNSAMSALFHIYIDSLWNLISMLGAELFREVSKWWHLPEENFTSFV